MKKPQIFIVILLTLFLASTTVKGQLTVTHSIPATQLASTLAGTGVTIINASYTGSPLASGVFYAQPATGPGIQSGMIMTTGHATTVIGPNNNSMAGVGLSEPGSSLINNMLNGAISYDATELTLEFIPIGDTLRFKFVFGSEEYPEFVFSNFGDAFGAFLSGLNPSTMTPYSNENIALVPGTALPVIINNINNGTSNVGPCVNCAYYVNNIGGVSLQYDGYTSVITAEAAVVPMTTYTLRLVIADIGDQILDSGVLLEGGSLISFPSGGFYQQYTPSIETSKALEGCSEAVLGFVIATPAIDTVAVNINSISGSATQGVDYPPLPQQLLILPGSQQVLLTIEPNTDMISEGDEDIIIGFSIGNLHTGTATVIIADYNPIQINKVPDPGIPCNGYTQLWVQPQDGIPPYTYSWSDPNTLSNSNIPNPFAFPLNTTTYTVTVADSSGCGIASTYIVVKISLLSQQPQDQTAAFGSNAQFSASCTDPLATYQWQIPMPSGPLDLSDGQKYSGTQTSILTVNNINASDTAYAFRCKVTLKPCLEYSQEARIIYSSFIAGHQCKIPFRIHPNPTSGLLVIETEAYPATLQITDLAGRIIRETQLNLPHNQSDIRSLRPGIYGVRIITRSSGETFTTKIIKE